ncbi:MAG: AbrB/MazE/SpoVT family DNA-binding domain-containing protein [Burkholderiales bacterium]
MSLATVTSKGQVTLPKELRDALKITPGSKLGFKVLANGRAEMQVIESHPLSIAGILHKPGRKSKSLEEIGAGIARAMIQKHRKPRG